MLTQYEAEMAARCAEKYPKNHGGSFFCDRETDDFDNASRRVNNEPITVVFG